MSTQASFQIAYLPEQKSASITLTPYELAVGSPAASTDVKDPFLRLSAPGIVARNIHLRVFTAADEAAVATNETGLIDTREAIVIDNLVPDVDYQLSFYCLNGSVKPESFKKGLLYLPKPTGAPVLGSANWTLDTTILRVNMTVPDLRVTGIIATILKVVESGVDTNENSIVLSSAQVTAIRTNGYHDFAVSGAGGFYAAATGDTIRLRLTATDGNDYSDDANAEYELVAKPLPPQSISVVDSNSTFKLLTATIRVNPSQVFDKMEILTQDKNDKWTIVVRTVLYDAAITTSDMASVSGKTYTATLSVELGSVAKYAVRIVNANGAKSDQVVTSGYVLDKYILANPTLTATFLSYGYTTTYPAANYQHVELKIAAGVSSFENRSATIVYRNGAADSNAAFTTTFTIASGSRNLDAEGNARITVFIAKLTSAQFATFQIAIDGLVGNYTGVQQLLLGSSAAPSGSQGLNDAVITSNPIGFPLPALSAPVAVGAIVATAFDAGVMVRWTPGTSGDSGLNNAASGYAVQMYTYKGFPITERGVYKLVTDEYAIFSGLENDQDYWFSVQSVNDADNGPIVRSTVVATPRASLLPDGLLTVSTSVKSRLDNSVVLTFNVKLASPPVDMASISIQQLDALGANDGEASVITLSGNDQKFASSQTEEVTITGNADAYFAIFATSVSGSVTPYVFTTLFTALEPDIQASSGWVVSESGPVGNKTTSITVEIDNNRSELTLAQVIAIPSADYAGEPNIIHDLKKGAAVSGSTTNFKYSVIVPYAVAVVGATATRVLAVIAANAAGKDIEHVSTA
jgi:hypothetical protein